MCQPWPSGTQFNNLYWHDVSKFQNTSFQATKPVRREGRQGSSGDKAGKVQLQQQQLAEIVETEAETEIRATTETATLTAPQIYEQCTIWL